MTADPAPPPPRSPRPARRELANKIRALEKQLEHLAEVGLRTSRAGLTLIEHVERLERRVAELEKVLER